MKKIIIPVLILLLLTGYTPYVEVNDLVIVDMLGLEKLSSLFGSVKKTAEILCGIILYTSLMFFLTVIIFTKSTTG